MCINERVTHQAQCIRHGNYDLCVVIPDHPPEVLYGVWQRILGSDELAALMVPL